MPDEHDEESASDPAGESRAAPEKDDCCCDAFGFWLRSTATDPDTCRCLMECCGGRFGMCMLKMLFALVAPAFVLGIVGLHSPNHDAYVAGQWLIAYAATVFFGVPCLLAACVICTILNEP